MRQPLRFLERGHGSPRQTALGASVGPAGEAKKRKENSPLDHLTISPSIYNDIVSRHGGTPASKATYHRALNELIEAGFIVRSKLEHRYWINPAIFFIGSRVKLVTEIRERPQIFLPGEGEE